MNTHRAKYEEINEQLVRAVVKYRKKAANLEQKLIEQNRFAQNQYDENVVLRRKLTDKENYARMMQSSAIELISNNSMQIQNFLIKTGLKISSRHPKQKNVQMMGKQSHISMKKEPERDKSTAQPLNNEKHDSHQNKPVRSHSSDLCYYYCNNCKIPSLFSDSIKSFRKINRSNIIISKRIVIGFG